MDSADASYFIMALSRSQWLAVSGGGLVTAGGLLVTLSGPRADGGGVLSSGTALDVDTLVRLVGTLSLPYGIVVILVSTWFATSRHFVVSSVVGIAATVIAAIQMYEFGGHALSKEWMILGVGNCLVAVAALLDRNAYRAFLRARGTVAPD
jgi:hypothetical protein